MATKKHPKTKRTRRLAAKPKFTLRSLLVFITVFAAVGGWVLWFSSAAPAAPTIYLTPASQTVGPLTNFSVQVRENSGATTVNAVQANFSYDPALVDFVSIDGTNSAFPVDASSTGGSGSVSIARGITSTLTGDQLVATVNFKSKSASGAVAMSFTNGTALVSSTTNQDILGSLAATGGGTYTVDATAPAVTITSPTNGATIGAPATTNISVTATDAGTVSSVDFYIDGVKVNTDTTSPYTYAWNTTGLSLASHTIQAKATDPSGNVGTSSLFTVTLADQTAPTVSITSPSGGAFLAGTTTVSATAADNTGGTGISKVEFYVDGVLKSTDTVAPYSFSWDTTTASNASHSLTAKAYDSAGTPNVTTSSAVSVTADNSAPSTPGNFHTTATALTSISLAWTASADNNSVTGYRITRNGTTVTTTSGATLAYVDSGLATGTNYSYTIVALDAANNASAAASLSASTVTAKPGDINGDGQVDVFDLSILLTHWNTTDAASDLNHDGIVNIFDLSVLLSHWGT